MGAKEEDVYQKILVGFQSTEQGRDAIALGRVLAMASGAPLLVASVSSEPDGTEAERLTGYVRTHLGDLEVAVEGRSVKAASPAAGLAELARSANADLIVIGSSHRGPLGRILPGGTAERLLRGAPCSVAIASRGFGASRESEWHPLGEASEDAGIRVIGVGYDGSAEAGDALQAASELATRNRAALRVFAVAPPTAHNEKTPEESWSTAMHTGIELGEALRRAVSGLPAEARADPILLHGPPASQLITAAEKGVDLLVMGSQGAGPLKRALLGSVSAEVLSSAPCPVLIAPRGAGSRSNALSR